MPEVVDKSFNFPDLHGKMLDHRFLVQKYLHYGNFGVVYLAEQQVFRVPLRPVAIKLLFGEVVTESNATESLRDAITLIRLQQEPMYGEVAHHMVSVIDAGFLSDMQGQAYILMEYVEGYAPPGGGRIRSLDRLIMHYSPVPVDLALSWMLQMLKPLAWMHTLIPPVLHCDLKPDNILVTSDCTLKVADFGLAQLVIGIYGTLGPCGALAYQAPELLSGFIHPTPASDVYSLGLMFYEILSGQNPLCHVGSPSQSDDENNSDYVRLQVEARLRGLPSLCECGHPELREHPILIEIVERCLNVQGSKRYENASALMNAVTEYAEADKDSIEWLLRESDAYTRKEMLDQARRRCDKAIDKYPESGKAYASRARIILAEGKPQEALAVCARGRAVDDKEPTVYEVMADAYHDLGQDSLSRQMRQAADQRRLRRAR